MGRNTIEAANAKGTGVIVRGSGSGTTKRAPPTGEIFECVGLDEPLEWGGLYVARL